MNSTGTAHAVCHDRLPAPRFLQALVNDAIAVVVRASAIRVCSVKRNMTAHVEQLEFPAIQYGLASARVDLERLRRTHADRSALPSLCPLSTFRPRVRVRC